MSFGDALRKAASGGEMIEPPKGPYKVKLDAAEAWESPKDGREYAKVTLEIVEGEHQGGRFEHWIRFSSEMQKSLSVEALAAYGVRLDSIEEITDVDDQLGTLVAQGTVADISVSYGGSEGQFLNVKVHGSRTAGVSDIPSDLPEQPASFASAAGQDNDDVSWMS